MPGGPNARRIAALTAVINVRDTVFAHGGITPRWRPYGTDRINREVSE